MSMFEALAPKYRLVKTHWDDDLQAVAQREMGDANRWPELVWLNKLTHPYLTTDPRLVTATVLLAGSLLKVPSPIGVWRDTETGQVYERDCVMVRRQLQVDESGDLSVVAGVDNFKQQILHRVVTPKGQARRHPEYGCSVYRLLGKVNGPAGSMLAAQYVRASLASDYRVKSVNQSTATVRGDALNVDAVAVGIDGAVVDLAVGQGT